MNLGNFRQFELGTLCLFSSNGTMAPRQRATPTMFQKLLTTVKHNIWAFPRDGITVINEYEFIVNGHDKWNAGECKAFNIVSERALSTPIIPPDSLIVNVVKV